MVNQNGLPGAKRKVTKVGALWATEEQISDIKPAAWDEVLYAAVPSSAGLCEELN
jgi:hypothetical protein